MTVAKSSSSVYLPAFCLHPVALCLSIPRALQIGRSPICIVRPDAQTTPVAHIAARTRDEQAAIRLAAVGGKGDCPTRGHDERGNGDGLGNVRMGEDWDYDQSTRKQQTDLNPNENQHRSKCSGAENGPSCHVSSTSSRNGSSTSRRTSVRVLLFPATSQSGSVISDDYKSTSSPVEGEKGGSAVAQSDCNESLGATSEAVMSEGDVVELLIGQVAYRLQFVSQGSKEGCSDGVERRGEEGRRGEGTAAAGGERRNGEGQREGSRGRAGQGEKKRVAAKL